MRKNRIGLVLILLLLIAVALPAQEESTWYLNKTIVDIEFENLNKISENELRGLVREYMGQTFTDSLSWEIMALLYSLDYFDLVETNVEKGDPEGNTLKLIFSVKEKPFIKEIKFIGNRKVRRHELIDTILLNPNDLIDNTLLNSDKTAIEDLYLEKGFMDVQVEVRKESVDGDESLTVYFEIEEGVQTKISEIRVEGNDSFAEDKVIINLMETKTQSFFQKGLYSESQLQDDILNIRNYYRERGYIDADVTDVQRDIHLDTEDGVKKMVLTLTIYEGDYYSMGTVTFQGNNLYTDEELQEKVFLDEGDEADLLKFERTFLSITDMYHENGYIFNNFDYEEIRDEENKTVSFVINIVERERAHIESITITGNTKTREYVIRRELPIEVGDVFSKAKLQEAVVNLYNTGYFEEVNPVPYQGSEDLLMDLELAISEGKTADILFGMTFSGGPDFPVSGQIKWNDRNFLGTGKSIGVETLFSFDRQSLSLQYNEPWLGGVRWKGGFDLSYTHEVNSYISQDQNGNGVPDPYDTWTEYEAANYSVPSSWQMQSESHSVSAGFNTGYSWYFPFARIGISGAVRSGFQYLDYDQDIYRPYSASLIENYHSWEYYDSFSTKLSWDKRNLVYDPTEGYIISQALTIGGILPQSINEYMRSVSRIGAYHTLFSVDYDEDKVFMGVLDFNTAFSYLFEKPWKSHELDLDDMGYTIDGMFVGKGWSILTGGKAIWDSSLTLKFPLVQNVIAFDMFLDGVGFWSSDEEINSMGLEDFRFSTGFGLRFANPAFPIGVYWVKKFKFDEDGDIDWNPEPNYQEFKDIGMDLVVAFEIDMY